MPGRPERQIRPPGGTDVPPPANDLEVETPVTTAVTQNAEHERAEVLRRLAEAEAHPNTARFYPAAHSLSGRDAKIQAHRKVVYKDEIDWGVKTQLRRPGKPVKEKLSWLWKVITTSVLAGLGLGAIAHDKINLELPVRERTKDSREAAEQAERDARAAEQRLRERTRVLEEDADKRDVEIDAAVEGLYVDMEARRRGEPTRDEQAAYERQMKKEAEDAGIEYRPPAKPMQYNDIETLIPRTGPPVISYNSTTGETTFTYPDGSTVVSVTDHQEIEDPGIVATAPVVNLPDAPPKK